MRIDSTSCTRCGECIPYCPAGVIAIETGGEVAVAEEICFDCGLCRFGWVCPEGAFVDSAGAGDLPRVLRSLFSDPNTMHRATMTPGRGTEESKTNDVTGRVGMSKIGLCIELGRPGVGCTFADVSLMTERLRALGVRFMDGNPLASLMDPSTARLAPEVLQERILSAIIEIVVDSGDLEPVLREILDLGDRLDTVFSLSLISRFDLDGSLPVLERLVGMGFALDGNAKVNMGLGLPLAGD